MMLRKIFPVNYPKLIKFYARTVLGQKKYFKLDQTPLVRSHSKTEDLSQDVFNACEINSI